MNFFDFLLLFIMFGICAITLGFLNYIRVLVLDTVLFFYWNKATYLRLVPFVFIVFDLYLFTIFHIQLEYYGLSSYETWVLSPLIALAFYLLASWWEVKVKFECYDANTEYARRNFVYGILAKFKMVPGHRVLEESKLYDLLNAKFSIHEIPKN